MQTRILMIGSAVLMALAGLAASFLPQEIIAGAGMRPAALPVLAVQVIGALYLGFAILNWSARGVLIGGIYARPVALGNFLHFAMVSVTVAKAVVTDAAPWLVIAAVLYTAFAAAFGLVLFTTPGRVSERQGQ
ncbi:MAG TPA: hypothetical protein VFE85_00040 [Woeseiaceae bacterium]|nr:hypothetical protein [Woeseiaceae bacterium]